MRKRLAKLIINYETILRNFRFPQPSPKNNEEWNTSIFELKLDHLLIFNCNFIFLICLCYDYL